MQWQKNEMNESGVRDLWLNASGVSGRPESGMHAVRARSDAHQDSRHGTDNHAVLWERNKRDAITDGEREREREASSSPLRIICAIRRGMTALLSVFVSCGRCFGLVQEIRCYSSSHLADVLSLHTKSFNFVSFSCRRCLSWLVDGGDGVRCQTAMRMSFCIRPSPAHDAHAPSART